jgi:serine/threonine protein kinase/Tfp pilus assembly protein PilF
MLELDEMIERFEQLIRKQGVASIAPREFFRDHWDVKESENREETVVELLRVWMEYRWQAGLALTAEEAIAEFPEETFSPTSKQLLAFEEQRQRNQQWSMGPQVVLRPVTDLPQEGDTWGDFQLLQILGQGAFARLFLARQQSLAHRTVALKLTFLPSEEAQLLASLHHSSIVPIYSIHCIDQVYGICMPFLGNTTFSDMLRDPRLVDPGSTKRTPHALLQTVRDRQLLLRPQTDSSSQEGADGMQQGLRQTNDVPSEDARELPSALLSQAMAPRALQHGSLERGICWMGSQLAEGLWHAHSRGILHSDIKPANILVGSDGQPRLIDFNISQRRTDSTEGGRLGGTYPYMSPEHHSAMEGVGSIDARADIYSLGMVLMELLLGELPRAAWARSTESQKIVDQAKEQLKAERISPALQAILLKAIAADAADRYANASDLADDLRAQYEDRPLVHQREPSWRERLGKWTRRHPQIASNTSIASLLLFLLLAAGGIIASLQRSLLRSQTSRSTMLLAQALPESVALASSSLMDPRQISAAVASAKRTLSHLDSTGGGLENSSEFWNAAPSSGPGLAEELQLWLAMTEAWTPQMLVDSGVPRDDIEFLFQRRDRLMRTHPDPDQQQSGILEDLLQIRQSLRKGVTKDAIDALKRKDLAASSNYAAWWMLGDAWLAAGQPLPAQQAYTACIALRPDIAVAYFNRASASLLGGQHEDALQDYARVLKLQPEWPWVRFNQAVSLSRLGKNQEALEALEEAGRQGQPSVSLHRLAAQLHQQLGDQEKALEQLELALRVTPSSSQDWVDRGLLNLSRDPQIAADDFENAIRLDPQSIDAHQKIAHVYAEYLGDPERACRYLDALVLLAPDQPTHRAGRAVLLARRGQWKSMIEDLRLLESLRPDDPMVQYQIASAYALAAPQMLPDSQSEEPTWSAGTMEAKAMEWLQRALIRSPELAGLMRRDEDLRPLRTNPWFGRQLTAAEFLAQPVPESESLP